MTVSLERPAAKPPTRTKRGTLVLPDSATMPRKLWTWDECRRLMELGLLEEECHYELLEGEIVDIRCRSTSRTFTSRHGSTEC